MNQQIAMLKEFIIGSVADDYESFEMLTQEIGCWPEEYKKAFSPELLTAALVQAIQENEVVSYVYDAKLNSMKRVNLDTHRIRDYWFMITPEAKQELRRRQEHGGIIGLKGSN
jgi:hypothetical protein